MLDALFMFILYILPIHQIIRCEIKGRKFFEVGSFPPRDGA
ncbi:hypothetical protein HMPREF3039_02911 [Akkermansia sp. KLE1798]|nr:hypothetical protein HMPREF3039_02911 [Akkermansia sp. KLE1798]